MPRKKPGARARGLGAELRAIREQNNMSLRIAAESVGWSKTILSRLETGLRNISIEDVAGLLGVYRVTGAKRDQLIAMARNIDEPGWWEQGLTGLPATSATLADYESRANDFTDWSPLLIPGLLQTMAYSRAFMLADGINPAGVELRLTARLRRQQVLNRSDVRYTALIGEPALRTRVGDHMIQAAQLRAIIAVASRPNVSIRVVPSNAEGHPGQLGGFLLLRFPEGGVPVVHVEMARSGAFLDEQRLTDPYFQSLSRIQGVALSETESSRAIDSIAREMESEHDEVEKVGP
jgi:transcriptional regulator with XRE-family HTH domain